MVTLTREIQEAVDFNKRHNRKLTGEQVEEIKDLYASKEWTMYQLGARYGVSQTCIRNVLMGISYR